MSTDRLRRYADQANLRRPLSPAATQRPVDTDAAPPLRDRQPGNRRQRTAQPAPVDSLEQAHAILVAVATSRSLGLVRTRQDHMATCAHAFP